MGEWYKLDNAAKLFPAVSSSKNSAVYRISVVLNEDIDEKILQRSVNHIYKRFPMLFVRLYNGVFWNYIDENEKDFYVRQDSAPPCSKINPRENNGYMLRILYHNRRISVECSHILTDGGGAFEFVKSLVYYYLCFTGKEIAHDGLIITAGNGASRDETEDSYHKYSISPKAKSFSNQKAYKITGTKFIQRGNNVTTGIMSAKELNSVAKKHGATITAYLAAALVFAVIKSQPSGNKDKRPIVVSVPVNLRKAFPSDTLRNFFCCVFLTYEQRERNKFSAILSEMSRQLREKTSRESIEQITASNSALERNMATRFVPLFLKNLLISLGFDFWGEKKKTMSLSNLGNITIPTEMSPFINRFEVFSYPSKRNPLICAICSVDDKLAVSFSRSIVEPDIIRHFFMQLAKEVKENIKVYSNDWGYQND